MISAFGVDHGGISKRDPKRKDRAEHYGRMSGAMGTLGTTATGLAAGSGAVGLAEAKGRDPMGFTDRSATGQKPLSGAARTRTLKTMAGSHKFQAKGLGAIGGASLGLAGAYKYKKKRELSKRDTRNKLDRASDVGLGAGSAAVGGAAMHHGGKHGNMLRQQAKIGLDEARGAHHLIAGNKMAGWGVEKPDLDYARRARKLGTRVAGVKGTGAVGAGAATAAGGAGLYQLGRHHLKPKKKKG